MLAIPAWWLGERRLDQAGTGRLLHERAVVSSSLVLSAPVIRWRPARGLGVPVTALCRGLDDEREAVFAPAGHGARIVRRGTRTGHEDARLGSLRGAHKRMDRAPRSG